MRDAFAFLGALVLILALVVGLIFGGVYLSGYIGPWQEQIRYNTFSNSQTYREGMIDEFNNEMMQYKQAKTDEEKQTIMSFVRVRFKSFPPSRLPTPEMRAFYTLVFGDY